MSDFQVVRENLAWYDGPQGDGWDAIDRIEAEFGRLRESDAENPQAAARELNVLRTKLEDQDAKLARLSEALTAIRDAGPQSYGWYQHRASIALKETT